MTTIGWIVLIAVFMGAYLLMHRGHGSHSSPNARTPSRDGHQHAVEGDGETTGATEPTRHSHRGC